MLQGRMLQRTFEYRGKQYDEDSMDIKDLQQVISRIKFDVAWKPNAGDREALVEQLEDVFRSRKAKEIKLPPWLRQQRLPRDPLPMDLEHPRGKQKRPRKLPIDTNRGEVVSAYELASQYAAKNPVTLKGIAAAKEDIKEALAPSKAPQKEEMARDT